MSPHPAPPTPQQPAAAAGLELRLHGDACVLRAGQAALPLRGRAAALVAMATLSPGLRREQAASTLWPDAPNARQNLRQQLLRFKQVLGVALLEGDDTLRLACGVHLLSAAPGAELLAGQTAGSDDFGQWLAAQRLGQTQAQRQPLLLALAAAEADGDLDNGLRLAQDLLALDPQDETNHAALMRLHYLRGEPAAGLAAYQRLSDLLSARLGTQPAASSQALAAALRSMGAAPTRPQTLAQSLPLSLKRPPVMAGRAAELAAVHAAWADGQAVLLEGEAGMGKSRLVAECLAGLATPALQAAGRPGDSGAPYSTLARLLRPALDAHAALLSRPAQEALARLVGTSPADPPPATRPLAPGAMQAAAAELLDQTSADTVVLDDLHFADAATLELISGVASQAAPRRWLFALRPAEAASAAHTLREALLELQRMTLVTLQPLDEAAATTLVDTLAIDGLQGRDLAPPLIRHSGGNPLFLLETLKQGLADGSLARGQLPRPASVGKLIERRLLRLGEAALTLARVAAIAGVDFRIELAEAAIGQSAVQLASAWQELQDAQVLRDEAFAHDLVAETVLQGVPPVVARRVHAQCAAWLAANGGEPARVARHWLAGGQNREAALGFEAAARRARQAARQAEEAELFGQAAAAYGAVGLSHERFEALASRVSALIGAQADEAALQEAQALPAQAHDDKQRVRGLRVQADLMGQRGPFEPAIDVGQQGIALARRIGAQEELVRLVSLTAGNFCKVGRPQEGYSLMLPLRAWVDRYAGDDLRQIWHGYWAAVLGHIGRLREGVASYDIAIACAQRTGERPVQAMNLLNQCVVLRTMGALERAHEGSRQGLALSSNDPGNANHRLARLMHARNQAESGRFATAVQTLDELLPAFEAMGVPFWVRATRATQARLWQHLGQFARALQALQPDDVSLPGWMRANGVWLRLEVQQWLGQPAREADAQQALAYLENDPYRRTGNAARGLRYLPPGDVMAQAGAMAERASELELFGTLAATQMHLARAARVMGQHRQASAAARALVALMEDGYAPDHVYLPEAWLLAGQALHAAGDTPAARDAWRTGQAWVQQHALPQVPPPFIESFLHRNPVNRELLALV